MRHASECQADMKRCIQGAAAGIAGTFALWAAQTAIQKFLPDAMDPILEDPGKFVVRKMHDNLPPRVAQSIPEEADSFIGQFMGFIYGLTFGALYAWTRPKGGALVGDGLALGLICWATGYLGWLPAAGLMSPLWRQRAPQILGPIGHHVVYGVVTVGAYDLLREHA